MKIFTIIQTLFTIILTAVNLVELLATSGQTLEPGEKENKAVENIRTLYRQATGQDLPAWVPEPLLRFAIVQAVAAFNKTGWFTKAVTDSPKVAPGGLENAIPAK